MTPRSIRRAAERKARKEKERKARNRMERQAGAPIEHDELVHPGSESEIAASLELDSTSPSSACETDAPVPNTDPLSVSPEPPAEPTPEPTAKSRPAKPISEARLLANRANAQLSTGPTSQDGRAKTSLNAVKTALTGRTVLLPSDDAAAYEQHVLAYTQELRPLTGRECDLVQSIADTAWRLKRIPALEMAVFALGHVEFADSFHDHAPAARPGLIDLKTFLTYEKQLRNLQLQESRLARRYEKETKELRTIQAEREARDADDLAACAKLYLAARHERKPFHPSDYGFEFSTADIESYLEGVRVAHLTRTTPLDPHANHPKANKSHSQAA